MMTDRPEYPEDAFGYGRRDPVSPLKCNVCPEDVLEGCECCRAHEIEAWSEELKDATGEYRETCRKQLHKLTGRTELALAA